MKELLKKYAPDDVFGWILTVVFGSLALLSAALTFIAARIGQDMTAAGLGLGMTACFVALWMFYESEQTRKKSDKSINKQLAKIISELEKCTCKCEADGACE